MSFLSGHHFSWQMILKHRTLRFGKQTLMCKIRPYYVKSKGFLSKNTSFFGFTVCEDPWNAWKKYLFSREIQNDDMYPTCQTMTLPGS